MIRDDNLQITMNHANNHRFKIIECHIININPCQESMRNHLKSKNKNHHFIPILSSPFYHKKVATVKLKYHSHQMVDSHFIITLLSVPFIIPILSFPCHHSHVIIPILSFPFYHSHFIIQILSFPFYHSHFIIPISSVPFYHSHFIIPILSFPFYQSIDYYEPCQ